MVTHVVLRTQAHFKEVERRNTVNLVTSLNNQGTTKTPCIEEQEDIAMSARQQRDLNHHGYGRNCDN